MRRTALLLLAILFAFSAKGQDNPDSLNGLDSLLVEYYNLSISSEDSNHYKALFFETFPDNFQSFLNVYGYYEDEDTFYVRSLYNVSCDHIDRLYITADVVGKADFIKKLVDISQNGYWEADAVNCFKSNLKELFLNNVVDFLIVLESYNDSEKKSFWHFFFDNIIFDHPYNIRTYGKVYRRIKELNYADILILLREQFQDDLHEYITSEWAKEIENQ